MNSKSKKNKFYSVVCKCKKFWVVWHLAKKFCDEKKWKQPSRPKEVKYGWQFMLLSGAIVTVYSNTGTVVLGGPPNSPCYDELKVLIHEWGMATFGR